MKKHTLFIVLLLSLSFFVGILMANESNIAIIKVSVLSSGKILLNGVESTISDVEKKFEELKKKKGEVWYYREAAQSEPPEQAMEVIRLVAKYGLPITLSTKPDFSDYVDADGKSHPRK